MGGAEGDRGGAGGVGAAIKLLTSFDGGDIHQESWSRVGSRGWDCSE